MINMNDFIAEDESLRTAELNAVDRVLHSGWYVLGSEVKTFEAAWAKCCGTAYAVGVGNGMDAIEIGLRALGIGAGDEVIAPSMTAFPTVLAIIRAGATPVLADVNPNTALLDPKSVARCISIKTKAVLLVHLYGHIQNMEAWKMLANNYNIALLEDCAQSHAARWNDGVAGSFGQFGAYSFYPTKNLGAIGDAGAIISHDALFIEQARVLRNYGQTIRYHHGELGLNSRLDELQAAILTIRLEYLNIFTQRRQEIADYYFQHIANKNIELLAKPKQIGSHVYHLFVIRCKERDRLMNYLSSKGVHTLIHYPVPIHQQRPCKQLRCDPNGLAVTEDHAETCLSIPCHPQMTNDALIMVTKAINAFE